MDPTKKFSFSFSKVSKINKLVKPVQVEKEEIQFVDAFDGVRGKFSYQGNTRDEDTKKPLVIPLVGTRNAYDVIKAKLDKKNAIVEEEKVDNVSVKQEPPDEILPVPDKVVDSAVKSEPEDVKPSLEALAAQEILEEAQKGETAEKQNDRGLVIVQDLQKPSFDGEKEATMDDYEDVPIEQFGMALLRGMGWKKEVGIGKESQVVAPVASKVRPKRLGLGAEGSTLPNADIPVNKGSYIKVLGGPFKEQFGIVEAVDGDCGRAFVKLDSEETVSLSENVLAVISKKEYDLKDSNGDIKKESTKVETAEEKKFGIIFKNNMPMKKGEVDLKTTEIIFGRGRKRDISSEKSPTPKPASKEKKQRSRSSSSSPIRDRKRKTERQRKRSPSYESPPRSKHRSRSKEKTSKKRRSRSGSESPPRRYRSPTSKHRTKDKYSKKRSSSLESDRESKKKRERSRSKERKHKEKKSSHRSNSPDKTKKKKKKRTRDRSESSDDSDYRRKKSKKHR